MTARQVVTYTCVFIFCVAILLLLEVALGLYLYKAVKNDFETVFVKELRQGLCKEEFNELLGDSNYMQQYIDEKVKTLLCKIGLCDRFQSTRQRRHTDGGYNHYGHNGFEHHRGEPGPPGPPGQYGLPGDRGIEGQKGERGGSGFPGAKGDQGSQGKNGAPGKDGKPGLKGDGGTIGLPGERGDKGEMGAPGKDGHSGPPGIPEIDPTLATPSPILDGSSIPIFGVQQPEIVSLEQLYPSPPPGPRWELSQCGNDIYPGFPNRNLDCELYAVEKPVFHGYIDMAYGSWMKDSSPANDADGEKFWITNEHEPKKLYEYDKENTYRRSNATRTYKLDIPFQGNAHVIFNGSFYYQAQGKPKIIRYFLNNETRMELGVPRLNVTSGNYLYTTENNYIDFSVDDNGLWVIFPVPDANNTAIMKVDVSSMQIQYIWNISLDHHLVGEMFVVCGVLYAIDNVTDRNTRIRFALDLYNNRLLDVNLSFKNPFRHTTMVGYNHRNKELYSLDNGNKLTYPIRYDEIGNFTIIDGKFEHNEFLNK